MPQPGLPEPPQVGDTYRLEGELIYCQDFSFWRGTFPADLVWTVGRVHDGGRLFLQAPGYGVVGDYGGGGISMAGAEFADHARKVEPA